MNSKHFYFIFLWRLSKELYTRKFFQKKSCDHIHVVIYRTHLSGGILMDIIYQEVSSTAKNTVISPDFLVWKFYGKAQFPHSFRRIRPKLCRNPTFPQNFHTRKSDEITVFFAVINVTFQLISCQKSANSIQ